MTETETALDHQPELEPERAILCRECAHTITRSSHLIERQGAHEHTFRNPAGYSFHLLCYQQAEGCLCSGTPTTEASWFLGYAWSFALCGACHTHLGWRFSDGDETFFGLIATRLQR